MNGQVVDRNEYLLPDQVIQVRVNSGGFSYSDLIPFVKTNHLGEFEMIFPKAEGNISYEIRTVDNTSKYLNRSI